MSLLKYLTPDTVTADLQGSNKQEIIESLLDILMKTGRIRDRESALGAILEREKKMSTGMENGIAIPHGKTDVVDDLIAAVGISRNAVDFDALDKQPSRIFIMTLSSSQRTGPHIQFLKEISELLRSADMRRKLLAAKESRGILQILADSL
ncbi:MAG: PTS sugar transporter subunit IIA [Spirochaetales bacterium]|jgi:PTS system nitrogen regulatory IIA component|nr:PTS sugar transporter subunit IIA [Spirochaetales bacterium]